MGVLEIHAPDGRLWWVKRAWVPRYRTLRERVALYYAEREPHWYDAPLRWAAGPPRYRDVVPTGSRLAVGSERLRLDDAHVVDGVDLLLDPTWLALPPTDLSFDAGEVGQATADAAARLLDAGGGSSLPGDLGPLDIGGGSDLVGDVGAGGGGGLLDVGGGSSDGGGGGGGGFDLDADDGLPIVLVAILAVVAAVVALALLWFVVVPLLLVVMDGAVLLAIVVVAGLVRLLFRRPWDVVAVEDLEGGDRRIRRWEVRGYRRAGRVRDDVARAIATGTDPDLAVVRVLVRDPRDDDPAGSARSVTEIEGLMPNPAQHVTVQDRRSGTWAAGRVPHAAAGRGRPRNRRTAWDDLEEALERVDETSGAQGGDPDQRYSPAELRTALRRLDERALDVPVDPGSEEEQARRAAFREAIRMRLEASEGTDGTGPTYWFEDPRDGLIHPG